MQAAMEAIKSRWGVLVFNKTYKIGADPTKGEIEADPRFKYDPTFLHQNVLPAFLNRVLVALVDLMEKDINYDCTEEALKAIQAENSHLFQFCQDTGLRYDPNGMLTAGEIWQVLEQWYIDNGTLSYEEGANGKQKSIWTEQARKGDANVKGANQVIPRFQALFPKTKRVTVGKGKMALQGISFAPPPGDGEPVEPVGEAMVSQLVSQKPLIYKDGEPVTPVSYIEQENETQLEPNEVNHAASALHEANGCEKLPQLAHHSDIAREKASPTASPTASPDGQTASPAPSISAEELAEMLLVCDCAEAVVQLRSVPGVTPELLNQACKRLGADKHAQIKAWVIELNSRLKVGDRVFINCWPHTDRLGPYSIEWVNNDSGIAKVEGFASPIALVDLRKATE
jgi:putative DNA primase/helicase